MTSAFFWYHSWAHRVRVAPARAVADTHTHTQTDTHYEYCNLAPAWARLIIQLCCISMQLEVCESFNPLLTHSGLLHSPSAVAGRGRTSLTSRGRTPATTLTSSRGFQAPVKVNSIIVPLGIKLIHYVIYCRKIPLKLVNVVTMVTASGAWG